MGRIGLEIPTGSLPCVGPYVAWAHVSPALEKFVRVEHGGTHLWSQQLTRLRQEDLQFQASLCYIVRA